MDSLDPSRSVPDPNITAFKNYNSGRSKFLALPGHTASGLKPPDKSKLTEINEFVKRTLLGKDLSHEEAEHIIKGMTKLVLKIDEKMGIFNRIFGGNSAINDAKEIIEQLKNKRLNNNKAISDKFQSKNYDVVNNKQFPIVSVEESTADSQMHQIYDSFRTDAFKKRDFFIDKDKRLCVIERRDLNKFNFVFDITPIEDKATAQAKMKTSTEGRVGFFIDKEDGSIYFFQKLQDGFTEGTQLGFNSLNNMKYDLHPHKTDDPLPPQGYQTVIY